MFEFDFKQFTNINKNEIKKSPNVTLREEFQLNFELPERCIGEQAVTSHIVPNYGSGKLWQAISMSRVGAAELINTPPVDVIIVGAGLSGLTAAIRILEMERTLQVKILEASGHVGGQMETTKLGEIGAKWIGPDQYHIYRLMQAMQVPMKRRHTLAPQLQRVWDLDKGMFAGLAKYELNRYLRELNIKVQFFRPGRHQRKSISMLRHIQKRLFFSQSRAFMTNLVQFIAGTQADCISYAEFMTICYTCGGLNTFMDMHFYCPDGLMEISSEKLIQALLGRLKPVEIVLHHQINEIHHFKDYVEMIDNKSHVHTASAVILAIPWNCIRDIFITPSIPLELRKPAADMKHHSKPMVTTFLIRYNDGYWRQRGSSGSIVCTEPMIMVNEYRPTTLSGFMVHSEGMDLAVYPIVLQTLARTYGDVMLRPTDYEIRTYEVSSMVNTPLTAPWNRIVWASSAGAATCFRGCLSGAVQSGLRAAMNLMLILRPQTVSTHDVAEIDCAGNLHKREINWTRLFFSAWNLYNVTYYSLFVCGVVGVLMCTYKKVR